MPLFHFIPPFILIQSFVYVFLVYLIVDEHYEQGRSDHWTGLILRQCLIAWTARR